jgi:cytochrome c553
VSSSPIGPRCAAAVISAAALLLVTISQAAYAADAEAGRKKAQVCVACHGPGGNSTNPAVPSLAAQPSQFIVTQLVMFREGNRKDPQMSPVAQSLTNADLNDLGVFFSAQTHAPPAQATDPGKTAFGRRLTEQHHCVACHGPALAGQQHIPRLAGQQREYLRTQLRGFKAGTRFDMDGNMTSAAQPLSDADIEILADYLSGLK